VTISLDIGSGRKPHKGFIGIDKYIIGDGIVNTDMWDLPYADNTVERIYSSHALEHLAKREILPTLKEWDRVLIPGGEIGIIVPDLEWCIRAWLEHRTNDWYLDIIFGNQDHEGEFHKTGFTVDMLGWYLTEAGFVDLKYDTHDSHRQQCIAFQGRKAE
jgi:predicted SAM-dependent methyltransferase